MLLTRILARQRRALAAIVATVLLGAGLTACGGPPADQAGADSSGPLTVYTGQHEALAQQLANEFTKASGIKAQIRAGSDVELANQIITEGSKSKADIFLSEEPAPMALVASKGLLSKVDQATLDKTNKDYNPTDGLWLAWAARARVITYNPKLIKKSELPKSIMDLGDRKWKGKFGYAPSGAFVGTVTYLINTRGPEATRTWLEGIKTNGKNLGSNGAVRDAVEAGQIDFGLLNHYYWYLKAEERGGTDKMISRQYYLGHQDPGALVFPSGAGVLQSSAPQVEAQKFLGWLASPTGGQQIVAKDSPQYPLSPKVHSALDLEPLAKLDPPKLKAGDLANPEKAQQLLVDVGII